MGQKSPGVAFYGKVRIPTIGHAEAINTAKTIAKKRGAKLTIGLSHTNNPLNSSQKRTHAEKVFDHPVMTGDEHTKNLFSFLSHLNKSHDELHLVAGSDRAGDYRKTLETYNGKPDKSGNVPFHFKKWKVHEVEGTREESDKDPTKMSREELTRSVSASKLENLARDGNYAHFRAYHPGMPEAHVKKVYGQIRRGLTLKEEITHQEFGPMLDSFVAFASDKLGIESVPKVRYKNGEDEYNSFAAYNPHEHELSVLTKNRHPMDVFRSVAHELVHHKQKEEDRIGKDVAKEGETGSDVENEANAKAGIIMRMYAKEHPKMFEKSYVVETNTAAMGGGVRGLGNVTGEVSPTDVSQYVIDNEEYTSQIKNSTTGLYTLDKLNSWLGKKDIGEYQKKATKGFKALREQLNEGINDPGKLKAIFLAGGPGSGKDYVMNSTLAGEGLREINSDTAFEYLMQKHGLDMEMPEEERIERDIVRGRAKNITKEKERLALAGRLGLIINGTADDVEKIRTIKKNLEADGYETMMVFVNTSNEVSRQRNVDRGKSGGRKVPDGTDKQGVPNGTEDIRTEKWELAQKNIGEFQKLFGNQSFAVVDNTVDIRKATPEVKVKVQDSFNRIRRMAQQFVRAENQNPAAKQWIEKEAEKRGITYQEPKRYKTLTQTRQEIPNVIHKPDNELMVQARRLGLSYYGFGRFGRKVNGINKVLFHSKGGKLVRVQTMNENVNQIVNKLLSENSLKDFLPPFTANGLWVSDKRGNNVLEVTRHGKVAQEVADALNKHMNKKINEEKKMSNPCWKGYKAYGMKKKNGREVPNCVPANEAFEDFVSEAKKLKPKKKELNQEALTAPEPWGYNFGGDGIGPTFPTPRAGTPMGFGFGAGYSMGLSESIQSWMNSEKTHQKFADKYGDLWEEKLAEAALRLEEAGCGCDNSKVKKSVKKVREGMEGGVNNMGTVPMQRKGDDEIREQTEMEVMPRDYANKFVTPKVDPSRRPQYTKARRHKNFIAKEYHPERIVKGMHEDQQLNERGADSKGYYRSTESGAGLTRKGAKHFGIKTAVTTPPSKLDPKGKAAKRRKSFCARMGGMKGPMKDEKGRPTRKAMSLRRWNCEE